ncbi:MAG: DUF2095 family protein, partial [Candidatus Thorarchaeota archaeon]
MSDDEEFRKNYPALARELDEGDAQEYKVDGVQTMSEDNDKTVEDGTFLPTVIDYI